jgi:hypothetical protein
LIDDIYEALARTALLLDLDIFGPGADHHAIIDGLRATTARIITDRANVSSYAGQTALTTLYAQLAMMGVQIDLDAPRVDMLADQPPLLGGELTSGLVDYSDDLLPGGSSRPASTPDVTFALGDTPTAGGAVRVAGAGWQGRVSYDTTAERWRGGDPVGALAAAGAATVEGLRAAVPRIAEYLDRPAPEDLRYRTVAGRHTNLDLSRYRVDGPLALREVDVVSGGAITNAAIYVLLRVPELTAALRVIEPEPLDLSNLNRYALGRQSSVGLRKTDMLCAFTGPDIRISGVEARFDPTTVRSLAPVAPRVLVGVDHIPSRWIAQQAAARSWVCVGASSHDFVLVSSHPPGAACAGCAHPRDDETVAEIPTISFVSFWAGLVQALELISHAARPPSGATATQVWPFGLSNPRGIHRNRQEATPRCPVKCSAATTLPDAA